MLLDVACRLVDITLSTLTEEIMTASITVRRMRFATGIRESSREIQTPSLSWARSVSTAVLVKYRSTTSS